MTPTLLSGVLLLTAGAPALKDKPRPEATLVGEWAPESVTVGLRPAEPGADRWVFRADGTYAIQTGGKPADKGDATGDLGRSVGTLDLATRSAALPVNLCRFRIDGDTLTMSVGHDPGVRPADLEVAPKATVWVMKRVKAK